MLLNIHMIIAIFNFLLNFTIISLGSSIRISEFMCYLIDKLKLIKFARCIFYAVLF